MTASRTSLIAIALLLMAWGAGAQSADPGSDATAPPRPLAGSPPSSGDQPPNVDTSDLKSDEPESAQSQPAAAPLPDTAPLVLPLQHKTSIEVDTLGTPDGPAAGLLDASASGFDNSMWAGSSREQIETLLARVPLISSDSAVRALARRLILSKSDAPVGPGKRALITIRIEKLLDAGLIDEADALAVQVQLKDDPDFARVQAQAILISARAKEACGDLTASRQTEGDLFWLQLRAYCAAATGDAATAELTRNVIDAQGLTDAAYNMLVADVLNGEKRPPPAIAKPSAMHVFLLRRAGLSIGGDIAGKLGTAVNLLALRDIHNPPEVRLAAAERIVRTGAASISDLKTVADAQSLSSDRLAKALTTAPAQPFFAGQVLLRRAAQLESRPGVKAQLIHQALVLGDKAGLFEISSRLQADLVAALDPASVPHDLAPVMAMSLLMAGKPDAAQRWLSGNDDAAHAILDFVAGKDDEAQGVLSTLSGHLTNDAAAPFNALVLGLYDASGRTMPAEAKAAVAAMAAHQWPGRSPQPDAMQKMMEAARASDRKGEAVLRILDIIGAKGPGDLAPDVSIRMVRALREMGLNDSAQALAVHALLLYRPAQP